MGANAERLMGHMSGATGYDLPYEEIREVQIAALQERFEERAGAIKLVGLRARDAEISRVRHLDDIVPLLLPHTAYKSYPESFLVEQRWDRLTKWLGTVCAYPTDKVDLDGIEGIDMWVDRLLEAGLWVSCSSGTTGKSAMLVSSKFDVDWHCQDGVSGCAWGSGVAPARDRLVFGIAPVADMPRNLAIRGALKEAYGIPGSKRFDYPVPPITIGSVTRMITLRRAIADGSAMPADIAEFEATSALRQKAVDAAAGVTAEALIAARQQKIYISGFWSAIYAAAVEVRNRGYSGKDFHPENTCFIGGGLKGAQLPDNYKEVIYETLNLDPSHNYQMYSMQELGSSFPRCRAGGRYHIPPWMVCLPLDKAGEALVPMGANGFGGEVEGRAAFFDLALDARWGGVITGDRIHVDFGPCACGHRGPSIRDDIVRYSDIEGDDKITCSGTIDAYVRGMA